MRAFLRPAEATPFTQPATTAEMRAVIDMVFTRYQLLSSRSHIVAQLDIPSWTVVPAHGLQEEKKNSAHEKNIENTVCISSYS